MGGEYVDHSLEVLLQHFLVLLRDLVRLHRIHGIYDLGLLYLLRCYFVLFGLFVCDCWEIILFCWKLLFWCIIGLLFRYFITLFLGIRNHILRMWILLIWHVKLDLHERLNLLLHSLFHSTTLDFRPQLRDQFSILLRIIIYLLEDVVYGNLIDIVNLILPSRPGLCTSIGLQFQLLLFLLPLPLIFSSEFYLS